MTTNPKPSIGFVGLGNMGGPIARRLLEAHPLAVFDRRPDAIEEFAALGAAPAASAADLARGVGTVFACLPESRDLEAAIFGDDGLAAGLAEGAVIVDMTTGDPLLTRDMAGRLAPNGVTFIDAPVSGGPEGAAKGSLTIMVGAEDEAFERVSPMLRAISTNILRVGGLGTGHAMKLANNMLNAVCRLATFEAVTLAASNGIEPARCVEILQQSSGRNYATEITFPRDILSGTLNQGFSLGLMYKDVRTAVVFGAIMGVPLRFGALAEEVFKAAEADHGSDADVNSVVHDFERDTGTRILPARPDD